MSKEQDYNRACRCAQCFISDNPEGLVIFAHYISNLFDRDLQYVIKDLKEQKERYIKHRAAKGSIKAFEDGGIAG